jgi:hypothetical protein
MPLVLWTNSRQKQPWKMLIDKDIYHENSLKHTLSISEEDVVLQGRMDMGHSQKLIIIARHQMTAWQFCVYHLS